MRDKFHTSTFKAPSLPLQQEVNHAKRLAPITQLITFVLGVIAILLFASTIYLAIFTKRVWYAYLCLLPFYFCARVIWQQAQRTGGFLSAIRSIQSGKYILYLRGSNADDDPIEANYEESLVQALREIGPTVIIDEKQWFRRSAAIRIPPFPPNISWTEQIGILSDNAQLIVLRLSPRRGYRPRPSTRDDHKYDRAILDGVWLELELLPETKFRGECLIFIGQYWNNRPLQRTNANGTLDLGSTTLITEIRSCIPKSCADYWPEFRPSRWIWFDPSGKAKPLGAPRPGKNTPKMFHQELSELFTFFPQITKFRSVRIVEFFLSLSLSYLLFRELKYYLVAITDNNYLFLLTSIFGMIFLIWFYRKNIRARFMLERFGTYDNCVVPPYRYRENKARPVRRGS